MKRSWFRPFRNKRLEALEERVERLEEELFASGAGAGATHPEEAGVPLARVLQEYLWGQEE